MKRPISWSMRFALALSAVFAIGTLSAGGLSYLILSREMTQRLAEDVQSSTESLAQIAADGDPIDVQEQVLAQVRTSRDGTSLFAFVDAETGQTTGSLLLPVPFEGPRQLLAGRDTPEKAVDDTETPDAYLAYGVRTGIGWVMVAKDQAWVSETGEVLVQATAISLAVAAALSVSLALLIARRNEARIDRMDRVLDAVGAGRMEMRIRDSGSDDLADLSARVDQMLDRLETGVDAIRQVSTDVAHDLRAPLSRLRMRLEPQALSSKVPPETRHEIGNALMDIDTISGTFDAILRLARLQSGTVERADAPVDLCQLAATVCEVLQASVEEAGHSLALDLPPHPIAVRGDEDLLAQALTNLIVNAMDHCPPPASLRVAVGMRQDRPVLSVSDNGPGIPAADRQRVLERFVRLDASRSVQGTGLGLSLVAAIATLHQATLVLEDAGPGLKVSLVFPYPGQQPG